MSDLFQRGVALDRMLRSLLKDYPVRFFLNAQTSHSSIAKALAHG